MKVWGYHLILDLFECNDFLIRDGYSIKEFAKVLCNVIDMTPYGEPIAIRFGKDLNVTGYSLCQFIEESNITGHFVEQDNSIHLDIFSCKKFNKKEAIKFCVDYFQAKKYKNKFLKR